jgi:hypothetical protein
LALVLLERMAAPGGCAGIAIECRATVWIVRLSRGDATARTSIVEVVLLEVLLWGPAKPILDQCDQ